MKRTPSSNRATDELCDAFDKYVKQVKSPKDAHITIDREYAWRHQLTSEPNSVHVCIDLGREDALDLATLLRNAADPPERTPPAAADYWLGTARVAELVQFETGTIRGWISRGAPKKNPFPQPDMRHPSGNYWRPETVEAWKARQEALGGRATSEA